ncbi:hypothetical protein GDO86_015943 [Hymenochirus boettgeri]|uniref:Thyroxine-binding globulin n=2 Tax=Hymenochirus TaxID=8361 RepID=A0A8T2K364_9PIPI|nr:hypothetical protein GDO86_015943 [Hymenochirus boettgeri]
MRILLYLTLVIACTIASDVDNSAHNLHQDHKNGHHDDKIAKAQKAIISANMDFGLSFYKHIISENKDEGKSTQKNLVFSPVSITTAFSMLSLGAKSETHQNILEGLRLNQTEVPEKDLHEAMEHLQQLLNKPKSDLQVNIGNAVFVDNEMNILESFAHDLQHYYHAEAITANFNNPEDAKKQINDFVKNKTKGKIDELITNLSNEVKLLLLNYIFLDAQWETPFNPHMTHSSQFFIDENSTVEVKMMSRTDSFKVYEDEILPCKVLSLPYKNNANMLLILPKAGKMHKVEEALSVETVKRWQNSTKERFMELHLPKFSISSSLNLKEILTDIGMGIIFSDKADFSGITKDFPLKVSKVVHKAVLDVDEKGTKAAAVTEIEGVLTMLLEDFRVDRPFIALICSEDVHTMLFMAKVINPTEK